MAVVVVVVVVAVNTFRRTDKASFQKRSSLSD